MRTKRARHYKPNYKHEVVQVFERGEQESEATVSCPLCEGNGAIPAHELVCSAGHEAAALLTKGNKPEYGGRIAPNKRYQNDIWHIAQSMATVDLRTKGTKSTGLEKAGKKSHMVKEHPTAFPVELPRAMMGFLTSEGETCFDPFMGSGSTIIAAEQIGRKCFGMDTSPDYIAVCLQRFLDTTGKTPELAK